MADINDKRLGPEGLAALWEKTKDNFAPISHVSDKDNPHEVTADQVGLEYATYLEVSNYLNT